MSRKYGTNIYPSSDHNRYQRERTYVRRHPNATEAEVRAYVESIDLLTAHETHQPGSRRRINQMLNQSKKRARKQGVPHTITVSHILEHFTPGMRCPALHMEMKFNIGSGGIAADHSPSLDRIIPEKGYVPGNIRVISNRANRIKNDAMLAEQLAVAEYQKQFIKSFRVYRQIRRPDGTECRGDFLGLCEAGTVEEIRRSIVSKFGPGWIIPELGSNDVFIYIPIKERRAYA